MSCELLDRDATIEPVLDAASRLIEAEFPRPAIQTTAALLRWHLTNLQIDAASPLAAVARRDGRLVGFAGATPRPLRCGAHHGSAHVVSFVCVAANERGQGLAGKLYDTLLGAIRQRSGRVLTFAIADSAGMRALRPAYARHGFVERSFGVLPTYGVLRGRLATGPAAAARFVEPVLQLDAHSGFDRHLDADPRGSALVGDRGARVVAATRLTADTVEPLLLLEEWPLPFDADALRRALTAAFAAYPEHGKLLVVPNFPTTADHVARAVGLRRLAGPTYQAWFYASDSADPFLAAQSTSHPII